MKVSLFIFKYMKKSFLFFLVTALLFIPQEKARSEQSVTIDAESRETAARERPGTIVGMPGISEESGAVPDESRDGIAPYTTEGEGVLLLSKYIDPLPLPEGPPEEGDREVAWEEEPEEAFQISVYEEILPNGLKVLLLEDPNAPIAVFQIWYNAGSLHEQVGKTGLSHLLEHMMFKGTQSYGPKTFSKMIKRAGGIDNAGTSKDYAFYYQKLSPDMLGLSIRLEADRMHNLILDPNEFESERRVVMEERRLRYEDDPQNLLYEEVVAAAFKNHPYRWPVIGWMSDLKRLTRDDLLEYYRTYYVPNNATVVVAGNIDVEAIMEQIRETFGQIPRGPEIQDEGYEESDQRGERRIIVKKEAELPYVLIAYKAPNIPSRDSYALEVLVSILSGGKSARIYRSLIDRKRIALNAGAGYTNLQRYPFLFYLYGTALPEKSIEAVERALYEEVERIKKRAPNFRELNRAKNQIEADFVMGQDSIFFQAELAGIFEIIGDWRLKDEYLENIRRVSPRQVQKVAQTYLVEDRRTVGVLIPVKREQEEELP